MPSTTNSECNQGEWPDFGAVGLQARQTKDTPLPHALITQEIGCHERPVVFSWHTGPSPAGHIMVANGYAGSRIEILDPWAPCEGQTRFISYDEYVNGNAPGTTSHWDDFFGFTPAQMP